MVKKSYFSIYIFRHGETTYNRDKRFTGFHDPRLTALGVKQARIIGRKLKNKKFRIAICTSLQRSRRTLKEVLKYHKECTGILEDDRIIERNYGSLNGILHDEYIQKYGLDSFTKIHRDFHTQPPEGESFAMVEKRVRSFVKDLIPLIRKEKSNIAISSHGNAIRLFRKIMEKASEKEACSWVIPYDKVFEYKILV